MSSLEQQNAEVERLNAAADVGERLEAEIGSAIDAWAKLGFTPEQVDEGIKDCAFNAWWIADAFHDPPPCTCPPALVARGGFSGRCRAHGRLA